MSKLLMRTTHGYGTDFRDGKTYEKYGPFRVKLETYSKILERREKWLEEIDATAVEFSSEGLRHVLKTCIKTMPDNEFEDFCEHSRCVFDDKFDELSQDPNANPAWFLYITEEETKEDE